MENSLSLESQSCDSSGQESKLLNLDWSGLRQLCPY